MFGIGVPSALIATVIYAAPPMARLTSLGPAQRRPGRAGGVGLARRRPPGSGCWTARLPLARKQMMLGLNQTIMMCLSMVVLASLIGAGGLGDESTRRSAASTSAPPSPRASPSSCIAVLLDRTTAAAGERLDATVNAGASRLMARVRLAVWGLTAVLFGVFAALGSALGESEWPEGWTVDIAAPAADAASTGSPTTSAPASPSSAAPVTWARRLHGVHAQPPARRPAGHALVGAGAARRRRRLARRHLARGADRARLPRPDRRSWGSGTISMDTLSQVLGGLVLTLVVGFVCRHPGGADRAGGADAAAGARHHADDAAVRVPDPGDRARRPQPQRAASSRP